MTDSAAVERLREWSSRVQVEAVPRQLCRGRLHFAVTVPAPDWDPDNDRFPTAVVIEASEMADSMWDEIDEDRRRALRRMVALEFLKRACLKTEAAERHL